MYTVHNTEHIRKDLDLEDNLNLNLRLRIYLYMRAKNILYIIYKHYKLNKNSSY